MAVSLSKGQKVDLTKNNPSLTTALVGLGWDVQKYDGSTDFDLDASIFLLDGTGNVSGADDFVFYGNPTGGNSSITHSGDNKTGEGDGDDETVTINIGAIPSNIEKIAFTVTIHEAEERRQNFGMVSNAYIRVLNQDSNEELVRFDLGEDFSIETAVVVAELYRHNGDWKFNAIGAGYQGGLKALCTSFGLETE